MKASQKNDIISDVMARNTDVMARNTDVVSKIIRCITSYLIQGVAAEIYSAATRTLNFIGLFLLSREQLEAVIEPLLMTQVVEEVFWA